MKKIMFNDRYDLTKAVIEGRKTMTRRMLRGFPLSPSDQIEEARYFAGFIQIIANGGETIMEVKCRYKVGEVVAVAQSYMNAGYVADHIFYRTVKEVDGYLKERAEKLKGWQNKMFVSANLMPHQIRITAVRCERLQDISDEDCLKEGIRYLPQINKFYFEDIRREEGFYFDDHIEAFSSLFDKVSGGGMWARNPWVIVYEFELVK